ncbi:Gap junction beta-4 protein isoform 1 [Hibiscus syriacus]|uniref:Gap junction beta-4 protein isoform 1 n=1 Tax=Hibiscus syriacus TaxID=106335 RepID=A0A6A3AGZ7_HIBSY|nr:Gap junction beta-4 protein isoform 1 [Hibiscus syriacus]
MAMKKQMKTQFSIHNTLHLLAGISFACILFFSEIPSLCSSMKQSLLISLPCIWSSFSNPKCLFVVVNVIVIFLVSESGVVGSKKRLVAPNLYKEYIKRSRGQIRAVSVLNEAKRMDCEEEKGLLEVEEVITCESESLEECIDEYIERSWGRVRAVSVLDEAKRMDCKEEKGFLEVKEVTTCEFESLEEATCEDIAEENEREIVEEETFEVAKEINEREIVEDEQVVELPSEELNKRVEDFIARVNKQRWRETQLPVL